MMRLMMLSLACCALFSLVLTSTARAADVPLIPREVLFGNPERVGLTISPDGKQLAWRAPVDGVMNVWVAPVGDLAAAKPVTNDRSRGIRVYFWADKNAQKTGGSTRGAWRPARSGTSRRSTTSMRRSRGSRPGTRTRSSSGSTTACRSSTISTGSTSPAGS